MTFKVHIYLDGKMVMNNRMDHAFRVGDTVRFSDTKFAKVTEVIWCLDERYDEGFRVNIRMELEK